MPGAGLGTKFVRTQVLRSEPMVRNLGFLVPRECFGSLGNQDRAFFCSSSFFSGEIAGERGHEFL